MRAERLSGLRLLSSEAASASPLPSGRRHKVLRAHPPDRSAAYGVSGDPILTARLWRVLRSLTLVTERALAAHGLAAPARQSLGEKQASS